MERSPPARAASRSRSCCDGGKVEADAVWDSNAAAWRPTSAKAGPPQASRESPSVDLPDFIAAAALRELCDARLPATGWVHEIKFDGYRIQMRVAEAAKSTLKTRKGLDWTAKYPAIAKAAAALPDAHHRRRDLRARRKRRAGFRRAQAALSEGKTDDLVYLRLRPAVRRRERLARHAADASARSGCKHLLADAGDEPLIRYVEHFETGGDAVLKSACRLSLEGIVSKQADAPYASGRTEHGRSPNAAPGTRS